MLTRRLRRLEWRAAFRKSRRRTVGLMAVGVLWASCGRDAVKRLPHKAEAVTSSGPTAAVGQVAAPTSAATRPPASSASRHPVEAHERPLATFDHATLQSLEAAGFGFSAIALGTPSNASTGLAGARVDNGSLQTDPGYASIVRVLSRDLDDLVRADPAAGVGMKFAHRAFDKRWLTSPQFHYELVAVVHRLDRRVFAPGTCGELRFVYRLAYYGEVRGKVAASRVPMTVNVVRWVNDSDCARWVAAVSNVRPAEASDAAARWMGVGAPLSPELFALTSPKSVEVNLQSLRWPSTVRPNMAGHAEYVMRVFQRSSSSAQFEVAALENTPDVVRLNRNPGLRAQLGAWLQAPEQAASIALGTVLVPNEFLATRASSVAPHGLARKANRPFSAVFGTAWGGSPEAKATLRRLDGLSCPGCHQSRSVAGFHVLGNEVPSKRWDTLAIPHSPHFTEDMRRRSSYLDALIGGEPPNEHRAPAERPVGAGGWGSRCGLDATPGAPFSDWACAQGFTCRAVDDPDVGECLTDLAEVGDACEPGVTTWDAATRDTTRLSPPRSCGPGGVCERNSVGFPGGMCSGNCEGLPTANGVCGGIAVLDSFNACIGRGEIFETCLATTTRPGALRRCSHEEACRDDYVCVATSMGEGACIPPYFLFQLRVDGHVY